MDWFICRLADNFEIVTLMLVNIISQVDTYGSMQREEKVRFVLEQMRLCLAKKDFVRAQIVSKKISTKFFTELESDEVQASHMCWDFLIIIRMLEKLIVLNNSHLTQYVIYIL